MKSSCCLRRLPAAAGFCLLAVLPACSLLPHHKQDSAAAAQASADSSPVGRKASSRGLTVELRAAPDPVKLGEVRQIDVTFTLRNTTKNTINLKFATSQTIEILLREQASGKIVSQWSTDQTFQPSSRYLVINPNERIEYNQPITTRELHPGVTYSLEAYFIGYEQELRATRPIIPQP
jgi:hypothetical protein